MTASAVGAMSRTVAPSTLPPALKAGPAAMNTPMMSCSPVSSGMPGLRSHLGAESVVRHEDDVHVVAERVEELREEAVLVHVVVRDDVAEPVPLVLRDVPNGAGSAYLQKKCWTKSTPR